MNNIFTDWKQNKMDEIEKEFKKINLKDRRRKNLKDNAAWTEDDFAEAFALFCLADEKIDKIFKDMMTFDGNNKKYYGIDGIFMRGRVLTVVQVKNSPANKVIGRTAMFLKMKETTRKIVRDIEANSENLDIVFERYSELPKELITEISSGDYKKIEAVIAITGGVGSGSNETDDDNFFNSRYTLCLNGLFKRLYSSRFYPKHDKINKYTVKYISNSHFKYKNDYGTIYTGFMKLTAIKKLLSDYEKKNSSGMYSIFSENVRYGYNSNPITKSIKKTAIEDPNAFVFLNNGITIYADKVHGTNTVKSIYGPKIINGQQTILNIPKEAESGAVLVRIMTLDSNQDDLKAIRITNSTNAQIPIKKVELISNLEFQKHFFNYFILNGITYKIKKGTKKNVWKDIPKVGDFKYSLEPKTVFQTLFSHYDMLDKHTGAKMESLFEEVYNFFIYRDENEDSKIKNTLKALKNVSGTSVQQKYVERYQTLFNDDKFKKMIQNHWHGFGYEQFIKKISELKYTFNNIDYGYIFIANREVEEWMGLIRKKIDNLDEVKLKKYGSDEYISKFKSALNGGKHYE